MAIVKKPSLQSYWTRDASIETPFFRSVMPRNRFVTISRYLHFVDKKDESKLDRSQKMRPVYDWLTKIFWRCTYFTKTFQLMNHW